MNTEEIVRELKRSRLWDGAPLEPAERARLLRRVADTPDLHVVVLPAGADPRAYRALWGELGLDPDTALLLLVGDGRWEARGWGLDEADIARVLDDAEPALAEGVPAGIEAAIDGLRSAAGATDGSAASVVIGVGGLGAVAALSGLGWILWRRNRLASPPSQEWSDARAEVEDAVAHLVLSADALGDAGFPLQREAVRLRDEIARVPREDPANVRVAKLRRLEDEVVALQSQVLAAESRIPGREG